MWMAQYGAVIATHVAVSVLSHETDPSHSKQLPGKMVYQLQACEALQQYHDPGSVQGGGLEYSMEMYCASCEVRTEFIYVM
jgi:hypothetical protein